MEVSMTLIMIGEMDETLADIGAHLADKLRQQLADAVEICDLANIDRQDIVKMAMGVHLSELLRATYALDLDEEAFLKVCRQAFQGWKEVHDERPSTN